MPDPVKGRSLSDRGARRVNVEREIERRADAALAEANDQANGAFKLLAAAEAERDRLRAENERLRKILTTLDEWLIDSDEAGGEMKDYVRAELERMRPGEPGRTIGCSTKRTESRGAIDEQEATG